MITKIENLKSALISDVNASGLPLEVAKLVVSEFYSEIDKMYQREYYKACMSQITSKEDAENVDK